MNTETVLARIVAKVTEILKTVVSQTEASETLPRLSDLEEQTLAVLPQIGQVLLQEVVSGQGAGVVGPFRSCACGDQQRYHDQSRRLSVQTSVGTIRFAQRACYPCPTGRLTRYPPDRAVGLGRERAQEPIRAGAVWLAPRLAPRAPGPADAQSLWLACGACQSDSGTRRGAFEQNWSRSSQPGWRSPGQRQHRKQ